MSYQSKIKRQQEAAREEGFHKRVTIGIFIGFALILVTATILAMVVS